LQITSSSEKCATLLLQDVAGHADPALGRTPMEVDVIRRQVVMPVSPDRLWSALTDPSQMAGWFGARVEWEIREGAPARFRDDDGTTRIGRVEAVRPGRHLRFRWWPEQSSPTSGADSDESSGSEVSYLLEPLDEGASTRLTVQERPIDDGPAATANAAAGGRPAEPGPGAAWSAWDTRLAVTWAGLTARSAELVRS
jgi:uncharacterized protein YndB with AHSA1/START domain